MCVCMCVCANHFHHSHAPFFHTPVLRAHRRGVIPRAVHDMFKVLNDAAADGTNAVVSASYLQIYNDKLFDLLADKRRKKTLTIREQDRNHKREVFVSGLSEYRVANAEDVMVLLQIGGANRAVRGTDANEASSRSHALLQLAVEVEIAQDGGSTVIRRAKLNLVDLAGSEKWNTRTAMTKDHTSELTHINKSLLALGNCIAALTEDGRKHIPYRDSKLTRLLQDSLGGNTHTTVIASLSPIAANQEHTLSTMAFADRARQVMAKVCVLSLCLVECSCLSLNQARCSRPPRPIHRAVATSGEG